MKNDHIEFDVDIRCGHFSMLAKKNRALRVEEGACRAAATARFTSSTVPAALFGGWGLGFRAQDWV